MVTGRTRRTFRICRIGKTGRVMDRVSFWYPDLLFWRPGGSILVPWEDIWVIHGILGAPYRTPWGPELDFCRFLMDFRMLLDSTVGSFS